MAKELANISKLPLYFFGIIKTGNNVLVSENLGIMDTGNLQPFVETLNNSLYNTLCTFWTRTDRETYIRTATTLKNPNGEGFAVGTRMETDNPAYYPVQNGLTYVGDVFLYGKKYFAYYIPLFEPGTKNVIGCFGLTLQVITSVSPELNTLSNITLLKYLTGPVNVNSSGDLVTKNQGNLTVETFQPLLEILDRFVGNSNTLFTRIGDDFYRTATTLLLDNNNFAIGYPLDRKNPAYSQLLLGNSYIGTVQLFGYNYYSNYTPILDSFTGLVIGCYFSGYNL